MLVDGSVLRKLIIHQSKRYLLSVYYIICTFYYI